jgi:hypothetical protein
MGDEPTKFDTSPQPLTIQYAKRSVIMVTVTREELQSVSGLGGSIYLAFFGICLGALVSFCIVLSTTNISSPYAFAAYVALTGVAVLGTLVFGIKSAQEYKGCRRRLKQLTQEQGF